MKKIVLLLLIVVMCFTSVAQAELAVTPSDVTPGDGQSVSLGDVDQNGTVNAPDALWVLQYAVGKRTLDDNQLFAADVSGQGNPSAVDALYILQKAVAKIRHFPVEQTHVAYVQQPYRKGRYEGWSKDYIYNAAYIQDYETFVLYEDQYVNHSVDNEGNITNRIVYDRSYFEDHSLLVFFGLPKVSSPPETQVTEIVYANGELCVWVYSEESTNTKYGYTHDAYQKLYVVELDGRWENLENIHFSVTYQKLEKAGDITTKILEQDTARYDFPV